MPEKMGVGTFQRVRLMTLAWVFVWLSACSDPSGSIQSSASSEDANGNVSLGLFSGVYAIRALNLDNIFALVTVDGNVSRFDQSADISFDIDVDSGDRFVLSVEWYEEFSGQELLLGSFSFDEVISANTELEVEDDDYTTTGTAFDADSDGFSNLEERTKDSNPLNSDSTPANLPDVRIKRISAANAPVIDGRYEDAWDDARFEDVSGDLLHIDNLMINQGALRPDGQSDGTAKMRWFAMHDDSFLYLFILGENVATSNPVRDSGNIVSHDDNFNIYIDGNNSKGQTYDGVDDRHILVPLLASAGDLDDNDDFFVTGDNSAALPAFSFETCLCTSGQHTLEIAIPMAAYGINIDSPFGIDIQIDIDHDGAARDAKWGWFHPSRVDTDVDNTWRNPSFMGTAVASGS